MAYPILLQPRPVTRVWGGTRIGTRFARNLPPDQPIGESWEVYGELEIVSDPWSGRTLDSLVAELGGSLLGSRAQGPDFPLLTKWLDCEQWLSIQVHPDDALARELTGDARARGKCEAWYFLDVAPEAQVLHGFAPGQGPSDLRARAGDPTGVLAALHPRPGQFVYTPPGTFHALGPGLMLYEIQQSSDITYRLYDWGRPRELHIEQALRSAECPPQPMEVPQGQLGHGLVRCPYFQVEHVSGPRSWDLAGSSFEILMVTGSAELRAGGRRVALERGRSVVLPANLGPVTLEGSEDLVWLRTFVP